MAPKTPKRPDPGPPPVASFSEAPRSAVASAQATDTNPALPDPPPGTPPGEAEEYPPDPPLPPGVE